MGEGGIKNDQKIPTSFMDGPLARCAFKIEFTSNKYRHSSFNTVLLQHEFLSNTVFFSHKTVLYFYLTRFFFGNPKDFQKIHQNFNIFHSNLMQKVNIISKLVKALDILKVACFKLSTRFQFIFERQLTTYFQEHFYPFH